MTAHATDDEAVCEKDNENFMGGSAAVVAVDPLTVLESVLDSTKRTQTSRKMLDTTVPDPPHEDPSQKNNASTDNNKNRAMAILLLNGVAILWGTQHAVIKSVLASNMDDIIGSSSSSTLPAAAFTLLRFGLAAILASPYTPGLSSGWTSTAEKATVSASTVIPETTSMESTKEANGSATIDMRQSIDSNTLATTTNNTDTNSIAWRWGLEMGWWMFLGFAFQAIGLQYTTAQRSGFLLYLNVKFVPFLARILYNRDISIVTWIAAATAFCGTALLAYDPNTATATAAYVVDVALETPAATSFSFPPLLSGSNVGDLWTIAAAAASAMFILRLERATVAVPNASSLNAACLWVVAFLSAVWTILAANMDILNAATTAPPIVAATDAILDTTTDAARNNLSGVDFNLAWSYLSAIASEHPIELIYLGGVATALANWIQTKAQKEVPAERAAVIYAMDPVYGAFFAYALLGETLNGFTGWIGASLITLAAATNAFLDVSPSQSPSKHPTTHDE